METGNLIVQGDTSAAKAFIRYMPLSIFIGIGGLVLLILGLIVDKSIAIQMFGYRNYSMSYSMMKIGLIIFGTLLTSLAIATPLLAVYEAKKCFISVYENRVHGAYMQREGKLTSYIPFEITFDKIESVSVKKTNVYIQIAGRTLQFKAFNANEIQDTISTILQNKKNNTYK